MCITTWSSIKIQHITKKKKKSKMSCKVTEICQIGKVKKPLGLKQTTMRATVHKRRNHVCHSRQHLKLCRPLWFNNRKEPGPHWQKEWQKDDKEYTLPKQTLHNPQGFYGNMLCIDKTNVQLFRKCFLSYLL